MLDVEGINAFYGGLQVLWNVSLKISPRETVALVGANGSGKTTLLNSIMGLVELRGGRVKFMDRRIDNLATDEIARFGISLVPEGRKLFPRLSVADNLELAVATDTAKKGRKESLDFVFELFPLLKERKKQLAGTLSGGEQQMLAIGRGLMSKPALIMLDEPSLGLAPKTTLGLFEALNKIKEKDISMLLVEQNAYIALQSACRGYLIENGRIVLEDDAKRLLENQHVKTSYLGI